MDFLSVEASSRELIPVLLGSSIEVYDVAHRLHRAFGVISHVFCGHVPLSLRFSLCTKLHKIPRTTQNRLLLDALLDFSAQYQDYDYLLCLIPCSPAAVAVVKDLQKELESRFVLLSPALVAALCESNPTTQKGGHAI